MKNLGKYAIRPKNAYRFLNKSGLGLLAFVLTLSGCNAVPHVDLAPPYEPVEFVVPDSYHGSGPFLKARPSDDEIRLDWWQLFHDPVLNKLEDQAMASNPSLQASAERFVQARDMMMKAQSRLLPQIGLNADSSDNKQSTNSLFRAPTTTFYPGSPVYDTRVATGSLASWEPDFWSAIRNTTRAQIHLAQQRAAEYWLARLSLQAEIASNYYILRGYDAQSYVYKQSIDYYKESLQIVTDQFNGKIASELDVARVKYLLHDTEAKSEEVKADREVTEHAIAALLNVSASSFKITPVGELHMAKFKLPRTLPSSLLERRPDVASAEREMAQANRIIGIARAAFFPNVVFRLGGGYEDKAFNLFSLANSLWSYGSMVTLPIFEGGMRRAELQQSWSIYRETEDKYRATILNAFREVEDGLSLTNRMTEASKRQDLAVAAALEQQNLTMELFRGGLISSLDLVYAQINTLEARINSVKIKARVLESAVLLVRSLGGGWDRERLPKDKEIQPFEPFQYSNMEKPASVGDIDVSTQDRSLFDNLTGRDLQ
jgi:NodT family efflux transporter outer membrane factor (OMF) lipoprotein